MSEIIIILGIVYLATTVMLYHAKEIDKQEEISKRLERLERKGDCAIVDSNVTSSSEDISESNNNQETGVTEMAASTDTNIVFRCSKKFKAEIQDWAKANDFNLSEACRNLINLELGKKQTIVDSATFTTNYVNYLRSLGLIAADADVSRLEDAAKEYAAYLSNPAKQ